MPWLKCKICSNSFYAKPRHINIGWGKYCSDKCKFISQKRGSLVDCKYCGKKLYRTPNDYSKSKSGFFFCNRSCHASWRNENVRIGEKHPNWISGINAYRKILLKNTKTIKCVDCEIVDERVLVVHHKDKNRSNNKIENLEFLCRNCHCIRYLEI